MYEMYQESNKDQDSRNMGLVNIPMKNYTNRLIIRFLIMFSVKYPLLSLMSINAYNWCESELIWYIFDQ